MRFPGVMEILYGVSNGIVHYLCRVLEGLEGSRGQWRFCMESLMELFIICAEYWRVSRPLGLMEILHGVSNGIVHYLYNTVYTVKIPQTPCCNVWCVYKSILSSCLSAVCLLCNLYCLYCLYCQNPPHPLL